MMRSRNETFAPGGLRLPPAPRGLLDGSALIHLVGKSPCFHGSKFTVTGTPPRRANQFPR